MAVHTERSTFVACLASVLGVAPTDVPLPDPGASPSDALAPWLGGRGLGLVEVAEPAAFGWAGPWLALRRGADGPRTCVLFGVPSGAIFDPAATEGPPLRGWVVAPLDVATWPPSPAAALDVGVVEAILLAPEATAPVRAVAEARALPGRGLEGDRYAVGRGTFASGRAGSAITLVDAEVLDEVGPVDHRRNVVVRGLAPDGLIGRDFAIGEVRCRGSRRCEPCAHLDRLNPRPVLRALVHRGGLRADVVTAGTLRVGDLVRAL